MEYNVGKERERERENFVIAIYQMVYPLFNIIINFILFHFYELLKMCYQ